MFTNSQNENVSQQYCCFYAYSTDSLLFTYGFFFLSNKFVDASQNRCTRFVLFGNYAPLRSHAQKSKTQRGTLYSGDETHYGPSRSLSKYSYQVIRFGKKSVLSSLYWLFLLFVLSFFSSSMWRPALFLFGSWDVQVSSPHTIPEDKVLLTTPTPNSLRLLCFKVIIFHQFVFKTDIDRSFTLLLIIYFLLFHKPLPKQELWWKKKALSFHNIICTLCPPNVCKRQMACKCSVSVSLH